MTVPDREDDGPRSYSLLTPSEWWRIPLRDRRRLAASVDALVDRQLRGIENQPLLRRDMETRLRHQATDAAAIGGLEMYLAVQMRGVPVAASLTTFVLPRRFDEGAVEVRHTFGDAGDIDNVEIPAGPAVRRRMVRSGADTLPEAEKAPPSTQVDYWVAMPGRQQSLQLSFSTPMFQIVDVVVDLFDAVASSLAWRDA